MLGIFVNYVIDQFFDKKFNRQTASNLDNYVV